MLTLRGAPALSAFRLDKLAQKFSAIHPEIQLLCPEYLHFAELLAPLEPARLEILNSLLTYGPAPAALPDDKMARAALLLVVPRPGTISPWSSKATDIAHNCGLHEIERLERGIAWYFLLPGDITGEQTVALRALVHDRMTESVFDSVDAAQQLFIHATPAGQDGGCSLGDRSDFDQGLGSTLAWQVRVENDEVDRVLSVAEVFDCLFTTLGRSYRVAHVRQQRLQ